MLLQSIFWIIQEVADDDDDHDGDGDDSDSDVDVEVDADADDDDDDDDDRRVLSKDRWGKLLCGQFVDESVHEKTLNGIITKHSCKMFMYSL